MQVQEYGTAKAVSTWQRAGVEPADVVGSSGREITWGTAEFAWDSGLVLQYPLIYLILKTDPSFRICQVNISDLN